MGTVAQHGASGRWKPWPWKAVLVMGLWFMPLVAAAHTITGTDIATLTRLRVDHRRISGTYELQYGEIAALNARRRMDTDGDGRVSPAEQAAAVARLREQLAPGLNLRVDGELLPVRLGEAEVLPDEPLIAPVRMTLRFAWIPLAAEFTEARVLEFRDTNQLPRLVHSGVSIEGMALVDLQQITAVDGTLKEVRVQAAQAPVGAVVHTQPAAALWADPFGATGAAAVSGPPAAAADTSTASGTSRLTAMLRSERLSLGLVAVALALSVFLGAAHALEPGHGKTIVAAYLIGSRGTVKHAILLGCVVTFTHTFSVILLGLITLFASQYILPEQLFPWLGTGSGLLIMGFGIWLLARHLRGGGHGHTHGGGDGHTHGHSHASGHVHGSDGDHDRDHIHDHSHASGHGHAADGDHDHDHPHAASPGKDSVEPHTHSHAHTDVPQSAHAHAHDHAHDHDHDHAHGHGHVHVPQGEVTLGSLLALGISGGIVPCPGALVILLMAVALGRIGFGLLLIISFSLGLAAVLIAIGVLLVKARPLMARFGGDGRIIRNLPLVSSLVIILVGSAMAVRALTEAGILIINL